MKIDNINAAIAEAQRFIERAYWLRDTLIADGERMKSESASGSKYVSAYTFPKESGAVRRASMDLTRSLAKMRGEK